MSGDKLDYSMILCLTALSVVVISFSVYAQNNCDDVEKLAKYFESSWDLLCNNKNLERKNAIITLEKSKAMAATFEIKKDLTVNEKINVVPKTLAAVREKKGENIDQRSNVKKRPERKIIEEKKAVNVSSKLNVDAKKMLKPEFLSENEKKLAISNLRQKMKAISDSTLLFSIKVYYMGYEKTDQKISVEIYDSKRKQVLSGYGGLKHSYQKKEKFFNASKCNITLKPSALFPCLSERGPYQRIFEYEDKAHEGDYSAIIRLKKNNGDVIVEQKSFSVKSGNPNIIKVEIIQ